MSSSYRVLDIGPQYPPVKLWDRGVPMEDAVLEQARNLARLPIVKRVAIMPDAHLGHGACVGSAILTDDAVIPAAVGVDIGCGMVAYRTPLVRSDLPASLRDLRSAIEAQVPVGRTNNGAEGDTGAWGTIPDDVDQAWAEKLEPGYTRLLERHPDTRHPRTAHHLGTLGTGNHFIEVCVELGAPEPCPEHDDPPIWVMLHSGSRGVGNRIGTYFTKRARQECERWHVELPDPELAFLPKGSDLLDDYLEAAQWAQGYAWTSRLIMLSRVLATLEPVLDNAGKRLADKDLVVHCHHNYVAEERHLGRPGLLTRKGAVNAAAGVLGIIPGSMGARSYITRGKGNPDALMTSSHGAGRVLSRTAARKTFSLEQHTAAVEGVECRLDPDVIDETPGAYKDIDAVMAAQADLTEPIFTLKQIVCVKG